MSRATLTSQHPEVVARLASKTASDWPRVWVITECYPRPGRLGDCAFIHRQLVGVNRAGCGVQVLVPNGWYPPGIWRLARAWRVAHARATPPAWSLDHIPVRDLRYQNRVPSRLSHPRDMNALLAQALRRELRMGDAALGTDILLCEFALPFGVPVREAAAAHGIPYVVHLRGDDVWVWSQGSTERFRAFAAAVTGAQAVLSVSQSLLDEARRLVGGTLPPSAVVPNGIDIGRFRPPASEAERIDARAQFSLRDGELVVLCVADALRRKGWLELIESLGTISEKHRQIVLLALEARECSEVDLAELVSRRAPAVRFIRRVGLSGDDLVAAYHAADVFCLASHWEGMANALLEALAAGLPVVTTAVAGHPEVVTNGHEGYLVPPRNVESLTEALQAILESGERRRQMGVAARIRAERVGDSDRAGTRVATLLRAVVRGDVDSTLAQRNPYASSPDHGWFAR